MKIRAQQIALGLFLALGPLTLRAQGVTPECLGFRRRNETRPIHYQPFG